jgi:hypothetical protein
MESQIPDLDCLKTLGGKMSAQIQKYTGLIPVDIVFWGSAVYGSYIPGRSDIDFITFLPECESQQIFPRLCDFHAFARQSDTLFKYLEGIYYIPDARGYALNAGIYIGTNPNNWRIMQKDELSEIDKAYLFSHYFSSKATNLIAQLIHIHPEDVKFKLAELVAENYRNFDMSADISFQKHAYESSCRSLYTFLTGNFISKALATSWVTELYRNQGNADLATIHHLQNEEDATYRKSMIQFCFRKIAES